MKVDWSDEFRNHSDVFEIVNQYISSSFTSSWVDPNTYELVIGLNAIHMNKPQSLPVVNKCVVFYGCYGDERTLYLPYTGSGT